MLFYDPEGVESDIPGDGNTPVVHVCSVHERSHTKAEGICIVTGQKDPRNLTEGRGLGYQVDSCIVTGQKGPQKPRVRPRDPRLLSGCGSEECSRWST